MMTGAGTENRYVGDSSFRVPCLKLQLLRYEYDYEENETKKRYTS